MTVVLETPRKSLNLGFSYEDYLTFLEKTEEGDIAHKFQFTLIFEIPTQNHDIITSNLHGILGIFSKDKDVRVYSQGTYIRLEVSTKTPLPDIVLTSKSGEKRNKYHQLLNPLAVIEILSKSTKNLDQTQKMEAYQSIETLVEYVLIDQYKPRVAIHRRISQKKAKTNILSKTRNI